MGTILLYLKAYLSLLLLCEQWDESLHQTQTILHYLLSIYQKFLCIYVLYAIQGTQRTPIRLSYL